MVDVSDYTVDTPVLIKIMQPVGIEIPELHSKTPIESYASIAQVIGIMNRGIVVDFPKESEKHEISKKIEDILIDYNAKVQIAQDKGYVTENTVETALDTISYMNNTSLSKKEIQEELDHHLFDYSDTIDRIYNNLKGSELDHIFDSDEYKQGVDRIKEAELQRKAWERVHNFKKDSLKERSKFDKAFIDFHKYLIPQTGNFYTDNENIEFKLE